MPETDLCYAEWTSLCYIPSLNKRCCGGLKRHPRCCEDREKKRGPCFAVKNWEYGGEEGSIRRRVLWPTNAPGGGFFLSAWQLVCSGPLSHGPSQKPWPWKPSGSWTWPLDELSHSFQITNSKSNWKISTGPRGFWGSYKVTKCFSFFRLMV